MKKRIIIITILLTSMYFGNTSSANVSAQNENNQFMAGIVQITNNLLSDELSKETVINYGYTTSNINIRSSPSVDSNIVDKLYFNIGLEYTDYDDEWAIINHNDSCAYISKQYLSTIPIEFRQYETPYNKIKSYMPYQAITSKSSDQYRLQKIAYTGMYGIRQVNGRFCIAVGSAYTTQIGQYIDLVLQDGSIIPCILGDCKADNDTNESNTLTTDGSLAEFIVDIPSLSRTVTYTGDISTATEEWESMITKIIVYDKVEEL